MVDDLDRIQDVMNELVEVRRSVCSSKPDSTECSDLNTLLDKAQDLVSSLKAARNVRQILDKTIVKTDPVYLNQVFAFEKDKETSIMRFDQFVSRELKYTADGVIQKSEQREPAKGESRGSLNKAKQYIKDADSVTETFTKATYLVGAIKFGLSLLLGIHLP